METKIKELIEAGKSDAEISAALLELEETKNLTAEEIAEKVFSLRKSEEVQKSLAAKQAELKKIEDEKSAQTEFQKQVEAAVVTKLKSINIDPFGKLAKTTELKRFNASTGKVETIDELSESYKAFNSMLGACYNQDKATAKKLSNEIDFENAKIKAQVEGKATPTVSDVTTRGGFSIPTEVNDTIMQLVYSLSVVMQRAKTDNIIFEDKIYPTINAIDVDYIANQSTTLAEKNPAFSNPTIDMERIGGFSAISNTILRQKGADIVNAFTVAYASAFARFLDLHLIAGNITGASDLHDGLIWDANTILDTPITLLSLTIADLKGMEESISDEANQDSLWWIYNRKVRNVLRGFETTGGQRIFPNSDTGAPIQPLGIPSIMDSKIPSVLDIGGDNRTGGTDDVLLLADLSQFIVGVSGETRIDTSTDFLFTDDAMVMRAVKSVGWKLLFSNTARALELTN